MLIQNVKRYACDWVLRMKRGTWDCMAILCKKKPRERQVHGLELGFDVLLLALKAVSLSYWIRACPCLPDASDQERYKRDFVIDCWCIGQLVALLYILFLGFGAYWDSTIAAYILFEVYLNLSNIVFNGKHRNLPGAAPSASIGRSVIHLFLNAIEIVLAFGIVYRRWLCLPPVNAFCQSALVFGTLGYPDEAKDHPHLALVALQVFLDFVLVVLFFSVFVGKIGSSDQPASRENRQTGDN